MKTKFGIRFCLLLAITATIGCDRVTKQAAVSLLSDMPTQSFLADTVRLEYTENTGAFLGLGEAWPSAIRTAVFGVGNALLLLALAVVAMRWHWPKRSLIGVALFVAGGAANLLDRLEDGRVIDFVNVGIGPLRTGIFNVADVAIMLGGGVLLFESYRTAGRASSKRVETKTTKGTWA